MQGPSTQNPAVAIALGAINLYRVSLDKRCCTSRNSIDARLG